MDMVKGLIQDIMNDQKVGIVDHHHQEKEINQEVEEIYQKEVEL